MTTNYGSPITGTLIDTTAVVNVVATKYPSSIAFNSTEAGKQIEFSFDGTNYYVITPTGSMTGQIYYILNFPVKTLKFTGTVDDTYSIL